MKMRPKLFTLEEANALIPELERRLSGLLEKKENYTRCHDELLMHELISHADNQGGLFPISIGLEEEVRLLETAIVKLEEDIRSIQALGCVIRNVEQGWIDFLGEWKNEQIYFCWKKGETSIQHYHSLKGDMTERRPLSGEPCQS
ncbi:MAG TPA: DUF2203 domain-containing protein [bacterium]|nr:DUF2203 domain-containing protein [bacterium]